MTTNRMGLEQTLSDDNLKDLSAFLMESYTGSLDTLRYAYAAEAISELLAWRSASVKPVASFILVDGEYHQLAEKYAESPDAIKLYSAPPLQVVTMSDGWKLVPVEPTENMVVEGFESEPDSFFSNSDEWEAYKAMSGCQQAAHKAKLCWAAMIAAAPSVTNEP